MIELEILSNLLTTQKFKKQCQFDHLWYLSPWFIFEMNLPENKVPINTKRVKDKRHEPPVIWSEMFKKNT